MMMMMMACGECDLSDLLLDQHLTCAFATTVHTDDFRPPDTKDFSQAAADKGLYPLCSGHCGRPCLPFIKKHSLEICIENPDLDLQGKDFG